MTRRTSLDDASRHLRWESFSTRIHAGPPSLQPISGSPQVLLFIAPGGSRIGLRISSTPEDLPLSRLVDVAVAVVRQGAQTSVEVSTTNPTLFRDFYAMCCAIADRVQLDAQPVARAISDTLQSWTALLRRRSLLTEEKQLGLIGELLFLTRVAKKKGWNKASEVWHGPDSEEHDFSLDQADVEVKTTRTESRVHQIASLTQLLPKLHRPLILLSVQVTHGGGRDSFSLADMVSRALDTGTQGDRAGETIRRRLQRLGWADDDAVFYDERYQLRAPLLAVPVDARCPAIIPTTLNAIPPDTLARIGRVSYFVNLDGLGFPESTSEFERVLFGV